MKAPVPQRYLCICLPCSWSKIPLGLHLVSPTSGTTSFLEGDHSPWSRLPIFYIWNVHRGRSQIKCQHYSHSLGRRRIALPWLSCCTPSERVVQCKSDSLIGHLWMENEGPHFGHWVVNYLVWSRKLTLRPCEISDPKGVRKGSSVSTLLEDWSADQTLESEELTKNYSRDLASWHQRASIQFHITHIHKTLDQLFCQVHVKTGNT